MLIGAEVALEIPAPVGVAKAVNAAEPRLEGRHEQVAVIFAALATDEFIARTNCITSTREKNFPPILFIGSILFTRKLDQHIHLLF